MKELASLQLDSTITRYLRAEAERCELSESDVASVAISLLALFRNKSMDGGRVLLDPVPASGDRLTFVATYIPPGTEVQIAANDTQLEAFEVARAGGRNPEGPYLRIVR